MKTPAKPQMGYRPRGGGPTQPAVRVGKPVAPGSGRTIDLRNAPTTNQVFDIAQLRPGDVVLTRGARISIGENGRPSVAFERGYGSGVWAARQGPIVRPKAPPGADLEANMREAERIGGWKTVNRVRSNRPWDYKPADVRPKNTPSRYEPFSNFDAGAVLRAGGWHEVAARGGAGIYQVLMGTARPGFVDSYFDDPEDNIGRSRAFGTMTGSDS